MKRLTISLVFFAFSWLGWAEEAPVVSDPAILKNAERVYKLQRLPDGTHRVIVYARATLTSPWVKTVLVPEVNPEVPTEPVVQPPPPAEEPSVNVDPILASADTYAYGGAADTPQGAASTLLAKSQGGLTYARAIYLKFELSGVTDLSKARLELTPSPETSAGVLTLWPVSDDNWTEESLTWNAKPPGGTTSIGTVSLADRDSEPKLFSGDALVAYLTTEMTGDGVASFLITGEGEGGGVLRIFSRESEESGPSLKFD